MILILILAMIALALVLYPQDTEGFVPFVNVDAYIRPNIFTPNTLLQDQVQQLYPIRHTNTCPEDYNSIMKPATLPNQSIMTNWDWGCVTIQYDADGELKEWTYGYGQHRLPGRYVEFLPGQWHFECFPVKSVTINKRGPRIYFFKQNMQGNLPSGQGDYKWDLKDPRFITSFTEGPGTWDVDLKEAKFIFVFCDSRNPETMCPIWQGPCYQGKNWNGMAVMCPTMTTQ